MEAEAGALAPQDAGTEDAQAEFSRLVEAHWRSAYRFAYRLTGNPEEAADLVQEAAEEAFRAFSRFRPGTRFDRWWLRILYNSFVDRTRRQRRQQWWSWWTWRGCPTRTPPVSSAARPAPCGRGSTGAAWLCGSGSGGTWTP